MFNKEKNMYHLHYSPKLTKILLGDSDVSLKQSASDTSQTLQDKYD